MRTLKKNIIAGLAAAANTDMLRNNKLILVTPIGMVSGYLCDEDNVNQEDVGAVLLTSLAESLTEGLAKRISMATMAT